MKNVSFAKLMFFAATCLALAWVVLGVVRCTIQDEAEKTRAAIQESSKTFVLDNIRSTLDAAIDEGGSMPASAVDAMQNVLSGQGNSDAGSQTDKNKSVPPRDRNQGSLFSELFKAGQQVARDVDDVIQDTLVLSPVVQQEIGIRLHQSIMETEDPIMDPKLDELLTQLSGPFLRDRSRPDVPIRFTVLNSDEVNAFAHVGGFIYINQGLLDYVADDSELGFIIGHEIGHVELAHCGRQATVVARADQMSGGTLTSAAKLLYGIASVGYSEDMELEADAFAYRKMQGDRKSALRFLDRLSQLDLVREQAKGDSVLEEINGQLQQHFATHPQTRLRIQSLLDINLDEQ